ncbi:MAG: GntR family transcriptional regulator [Microbacterium sp.]|uniref:GntR family transcriptional regulator n=1 Tax=Microbacterium sp. TaxID=51671 RepID=UPI0039E5C9FE
MPEPSQTELVYDRVRHGILELEILPGQRLSERGLEAEHGASRTPVRAALFRLEAEGLVVRDARAWQAAPIDLDEVAALSEHRAALESTAARLACARADDADLAAFAASVPPEQDTGDQGEGLRRGNDFHLGLARLGGNPFVEAAIADAITRMARARWLELRSAAGRADAWHEHAAIVAAISRRDADGAAAAIEAHAAANLDRLLTSLRADRRTLGARGLRIVGT